MGLLQSPALPLGYVAKKNDQNPWLEFWSSSYTYLYYLLLYSRSHLGYTGRARDEIRTRDINLGKVALYQLSYSRKKTTVYFKEIPNSCRDKKYTQKYIPCQANLWIGALPVV